MGCFFMDAHMHFDLYKDRKSIANYIELNKSYTIAVTNLPILFEKYYETYKNYQYMKVALGFHPELAHQYREQLPIFMRNLDKTRYIGEIGLDYTTKDLINRKSQLIIFSEIIKICSDKGNKILSVHSRKAFTEVLNILDDFKGKVILHWYSGTISELVRAIDSGYYFSINHQMINSKNGRKIIDNIPLERIIIESDAPFTNQLKDRYDLFFIEKVYEYLSESRGISIEEISKRIKSNFKNILI